jgi:D-arginine dehydrogenase
MEATSFAADVVIIGGGVAGLSLAAAISGRRSVVLVEAEPTFAYHTSSRSAQQMQPSYGPDEIRTITRESIAQVQAFESSMAKAILQPRPLLVCGFAGTTRTIAELTEETPELSQLSVGEAVSRLPALRGDELVFAGIDSHAWQVDVPALLEFYRSEAARTGATLLLSAPVTMVRQTRAAWNIRAGQYDISASTVVNAAGAWADRVAGLAGVAAKGLVPYRRTVAVAAARGATVAADWPMVNDADDRFYFRPDGGEVLGSGLEDVATEAHDAQPFESDVAEVIRRINAVSTLDLAVTRSWTGLRTLVADGLPVVGRDPAEPSFYWLAGQGGYGIQTSAAIARFVADELCGEANTAVSSPLAAAMHNLEPQRSV